MSNNDLNNKANISLLTANSKTAQLTYSNNKYGFTINGTFYEIGGGGMPLLDFANPLHTFSSSGSYTATKECYLCGTFTSDNTTLKINSTTVMENSHTSSFNGLKGNYIPPLRLKSGDIVNVNTANGSLHIYGVRN